MRRRWRSTPHAIATATTLSAAAVASSPRFIDDFPSRSRNATAGRQLASLRSSLQRGQSRERRRSSRACPWRTHRLCRFRCYDPEHCGRGRSTRCGCGAHGGREAAGATGRPSTSSSLDRRTVMGDPEKPLHTMTRAEREELEEEMVARSRPDTELRTRLALRRLVLVAVTVALIALGLWALR